MNIYSSTADYERWLRQYFEPSPHDLRRKHELMQRDPFTFFRATFYRWAQSWRELPKATRDAPVVLAVGDAHVENFGTWRDAEGRLAWGTNDFDEAAELPYTNDLVRLAASAVLAHREGKLGVASDRICASILLGYSSALRGGGRPIIVDSYNRWLHDLVLSDMRDADEYWTHLLELPKWRKAVPNRARSLLGAVPKSAQQLKIAHRTSGAGSLGRPRFVAVYLLDGSYAAREVKGRAPSAWHWANDDGAVPRRDPMPRVWQRAVRSQDPFLEATTRWLCRRLAPDCSRIDIDSIPKRRSEAALLSIMGWEVANIHLGSMGAQPLREHLQGQPPNWLTHCVEAMLDATDRDFVEWSRLSKKRIERLTR